MEIHDVIIIGGGAAGLGAALYAARFKLNTIVIAKEFGGTGNIAHKVDNWIGDPGISGWDLMQKYIKHVKEYNVPLVEDEVKEVKKTKEGFEIRTTKKTYQSKTILFANGMKHRKLEVEGEEMFQGKGVHYCYTCDGPLYKNKIVAVVGGGDSAGLGSLFMSQYATKVYLIHRRDELKAEPITVEQLKKNKKVEFMLKTNIKEIYGEKFVKGIKLDTGKNLPLDGVFVEVGHIPVNDLAKQLGIDLDDHGFIKVNRKQETNMTGVYAAGDLTNLNTLKQFITSASEGSVAAQSIYFFLQKQ